VQKKYQTILVFLLKFIETGELVKTFKQFIREDVQASKRVGIEHVSKLKPLEFISFCNYLQDELGGIISQENVKINLKIDGCGVRFGVNPDSGKLFLESSHSGPQYDIGAFSKYTQEKLGKSDAISESYDEVLKELSQQKNLLEFLKNTPVKVHAELLYTPNATVIGDKLQFLVVKYDKSVLGNKFTLVCYKTEQLKETDLSEEEIIKQLKTFSTPDIKIEDQRLQFNSIDISYEIGNFLQMINKQNNIEQILVSRKREHQQAKLALIEIIQQVQEDISKKIISTKFQHALGTDSMEGIVLYFTNGKVVKVVTDEYKTGKVQFNLDRKNK